MVALLPLMIDTTQFLIVPGKLLIAPHKLSQMDTIMVILRMYFYQHFNVHRLLNKGIVRKDVKLCDCWSFLISSLWGYFGIKLSWPLFRAAWCFIDVMSCLIRSSAVNKVAINCQQGTNSLLSYIYYKPGVPRFARSTILVVSTSQLTE